MNFRFITPEDIGTIHDMVIAIYGGAPGIRSLEALEGAVGRADARMTYGSGDPIEAAVAMVAGIVLSHPFIDGNKRTAFAALGTMLNISGVRFEPEEGTQDDAMVWLASGRWSEAEFLAWVRENIR